MPRPATRCSILWRHVLQRRRRSRRSSCMKTASRRRPRSTCRTTAARSGAAARPTRRRGMVYVNISEGGSHRLDRGARPQAATTAAAPQGSTQLYDRGSLTGPGAYSAFTASFKNARTARRVNLPCFRPPWGRLIAVDANTGDILWASRLGITEGLPEGKRRPARNNGSGGPIVTAGGLVFIGATDDRYFRAFDAKTGKHPVGAAARLRADDGADHLSRQGRAAVCCGGRGRRRPRRAARRAARRQAAQQRIADRLRAARSNWRGRMGRNSRSCSARQRLRSLARAAAQQSPSPRPKARR